MMKLKKLFRPQVVAFFGGLQLHAQKLYRLEQLEEERTLQRQLVTKCKILRSWALLLNKRDTLTNFRIKRGLKTI